MCTPIYFSTGFVEKALPFHEPRNYGHMSISEKYKGLINRKDWRIGILKRYEDGLTAIYTEDTHFYVFEDSVSRYTGFKNSAGNEIFEGDLLAITDKNHTEVSKVYWDKSSQQWKVGFSPLLDSFSSHDLQNCLDCAIVGHIFTHQHLLRPSKINTYKE